MTWWQKAIAWLSGAFLIVGGVVVAAWEVYARGRRDGRSLERGRQAEASAAAMADATKQEARDKLAAEIRSKAALLQIKEINRSMIEDERLEPSDPRHARTEAEQAIDRAIQSELEDDSGWK